MTTLPPGYSLLSPSTFVLEKYTGIWYRAASIPLWFELLELKNVRIDCALVPGSADKLTTKVTLNHKGDQKQLRGSLVRGGDPFEFRLSLEKVLFFINLSADYNIKAIVVDPQGNYVLAVIANNQRGLAILSRDTMLPFDVKPLVTSLGYDAGKLRME